MPILTLGQIASQATQFANAQLMELSFVSTYVNAAYNVVALDSNVLHRGREVLAFASTSTATDIIENRIGLPSDFDYAIDVRLGVPNSWSTATSRTTSWKPLYKNAATWFSSADAAGSNNSAEPTAYAEFASWLELNPSPNSAYSIELRYARKISELVASTSTPMLDEQWHWAIALKAAELLSATQSDLTSEARNRNTYRAYTSALRVDQSKRRIDARGMRMQYMRELR